MKNGDAQYDGQQIRLKKQERRTASKMNIAAMETVNGSPSHCCDVFFAHRSWFTKQLA